MWLKEQGRGFMIRRPVAEHGTPLLPPAAETIGHGASPTDAEQASLTMDMEGTLNTVQAQVSQLETHTRNVQAHLQRAQGCIDVLGGLCDTAEASVRRSQAMLNRSVKDLHALSERTRHIMDEHERERGVAKATPGLAGRELSGGPRPRPSSPPGPPSMMASTIALESPQASPTYYHSDRELS